MAKQVKRVFEGLEDAMSTLPKKTFDHSTRVSKYLEILFLQSLNDTIYETDPKVVARLKEEYKDLVSQIGLYHDIGKAMLPEEYQYPDKDFAEEEVALYQRHVECGAEIADAHWLGSEDKKLPAFQKSLILETLAAHHERWDGAGYPQGLSGRDIPIFARMVHLVDSLDHLSCSIHSEHPFEEATERIIADADADFDPVLVEEFKQCVPKMNRIFRAEATDTQMIPSLTSFAHKGKKSFALWYRPIEKRSAGTTGAAEAELRFLFNKEHLGYNAVEPILRTDKKMRRDLSVCAVLEACDAIRRFDACGFDFPYLALRLPEGWLNQPGAAKEIVQCLDDADVAHGKLCLVLSAADFGEKRAALKDNVARLRAAGCGIMLSELTLLAGETAPDAKAQSGVVSEREVIEMAPTAYRIGPEDLGNDLVDNYFTGIRNISAAGITLVAGNVEQEKYTSLLNYFEIDWMTGPVTGEPVTADEFVRAELAARNA